MTNKDPPQYLSVQGRMVTIPQDVRDYPPLVCNGHWCPQNIPTITPYPVLGSIVRFGIHHPFVDAHPVTRLSKTKASDGKVWTRSRVASQIQKAIDLTYRQCVVIQNAQVNNRSLHMAFLAPDCLALSVSLGDHDLLYLVHPHRYPILTDDQCVTHAFVYTRHIWSILHGWDVDLTRESEVAWLQAITTLLLNKDMIMD